MKFLIENSQKKQNFYLVYRKDDYAFDIEPHLGSGFTSIMINDLQLEIDDEGRVGYVWGFCPLTIHEETNEIPLQYQTQNLIAILDKAPIPGVSQRLNENDRWPIYINKKKGWICIGNPETKDKQMIEFAPDCIAAMVGQKLTAIWLHPKNLP